jgi:hypothetical protein
MRAGDLAVDRRGAVHGRRRRWTGSGVDEMVTQLLSPPVPAPDGWIAPLRRLADGGVHAGR